MTDEAKALVKRLWWGEWYFEDPFDGKAYASDDPLDAANLIETQAREIERLKEAIKVQARAVRTLQANEETEINTLRQQKREWHHAVSSLDSEREANAILTDEIERLRGVLEHIGIYGCGMLNQPAAMNGPEEVWLKQRIFEMERTARAALGDSHDQ